MMSRRSHLGRDVIVIGCSAGGVQALQEVMHGLREDLPASVLVVMHTSATSPAVLPQILDRAGPLPAGHAMDGEPLRHGRIYVARPDMHLLVKPGRVELAHGPKENGFRPAVDPLFRTAAWAYGPRVVGVILSGGLNDGTVGLIRIKERGGIAVVQDPVEALFSGMPGSAISNDGVDHVLPVGKIPAILDRLARETLSEGALTMATRTSGEEKRDVAEGGAASLRVGDLPGHPSGLTCPDCGGALWELENGKNLIRYQCHVGHSYTAEALVEEKDGELENALWSAVRAMEENAGLRRRMARRLEDSPFPDIVRKYEREAREMEQRASVLRRLLTGESTPGPGASRKQKAGPASSGKNSSVMAAKPARRKAKTRGKLRRR